VLKLCSLLGTEDTLTTTMDLPVLPDSFGDPLVRLDLPLQPMKQSRLSFLLRAPLAVPFAAAAVVFAALAAVVAVAAWVCAIVTGRVPQRLREFIVSYVNFDARFVAYLFFLVRRPQFLPSSSTTLAIRVVAPEFPLNQVAVVGRPLLALPALVVLSVFSTGMSLAWAVMLVFGFLTKRFPTPLSEITALFVRFRVRTNAYILLLTPCQPFSGFYGDSANFDSTPREGI
jgi:hypothetical protein